MTCTKIPMPGGGVAIVCTRGRPRAKPCVACAKPSTKLCDWKLRGAMAGKTCDAPICPAHATSVGPDRDLCPTHARLWEQHPKHPKNRALAG